MSFRKTTFLNIFQIGRFTYTGEILNFLSSIVMARLLLPEEYGIVAMILVITNFAGILTGIGISSEVIRSPYKYTFHKAMMNLSFYIGLALFVLVMLLSYPIALFYGNNALIIPTMIIAFKFIFRSLTAIYYALILKKQQFNRLGSVELSSNVMANAMMILMAYFGFSYWSLIIPFILADFYKLLRYKNYTPLKFKLYSFKYTVIAFRHSKSLIGSILGVRMVSYWARNADNLLIGKSFGEASLGLYNRGYRFLDLTEKTIENLFGSVLYPNLQRLKDENGDIKSEYLFFVGIISMIGFPVAAVLILMPDLLVRILWGPNWMETAKFLPYFGMIILARANKSNIETLFKLFYRELLLFKFGIFNSSTMVISIVIGSLYSPLMIAKLIAFSQTLIVLPVAVVYVFGRELRFNYRDLVSFYLVRMLALGALYFALWNNYFWLTLICIVVYFASSIIAQLKDLNKLKEFLTTRFLKKKSVKK